jgi:hypothetical protein
MTAEPVPSTNRKDLQDLRDLPRMPILSYLQKQAPPPAPRDKSVAAQPASYPILAAFTPNRLGKWIWSYISCRIGPRHPFQIYAKSDPDQGVYTFESDTEIKIALAGDWGTGTDEAASVGKLITKFQPHYSIHLGDVYYVGDPREVDENFLGIKNPLNDYQPCLWPNGSRGSFAMNGNHEMYARGYSYFDRMLPKLGLISQDKPAGQKASFFCLENDYWRIIALDTGYNSLGWPILEYVVQPSCALTPEQIDWLRDVVRPRDDDRRGIIILTHHQVYSAFDISYPKPAAQLAGFFSRPVLWFWGHEHRMTIYHEFTVPGGISAFGRCIGHGGMPVDLPFSPPKHPECVVEFADDRLYNNDENLKIGLNGFAELSLQRNRMTARYVDVKGAVIFSEAWVAEDGVLQRTDVAGATNNG